MIVLLVLAGCARSSPPDWRLITPVGVTPTALFVGPAGIVVGGADRTGPVLVVRDDRRQAWRGVTVTPATGYGRMATLVHVAAAPNGRMVALGTVAGGAHLNPRWTAWIGDPSGLVEEPQTVETFGGPDAGGITGVVYGDRPGVVGAWSLSPGRTGVAVWARDGATWVRQPAPPEFAGSADSIPSATAATAVGPSTVIVGLDTVLVGGGVEQRAVLWRSDGTGWTRTDLDGPNTAATDVSCTDTDCLVVGRRDGTLAGWRVVGDRVTAIDLPDRPIDRYTAEPRVARDGPVTAIAVGDGTGLLTRDADGPWALSSTPAGEVRGLGVRDGAIVLLLRDGTGAQQVYLC